MLLLSGVTLHTNPSGREGRCNRLQSSFVHVWSQRKSRLQVRTQCEVRRGDKGKAERAKRASEAVALMESGREGRRISVGLPFPCSSSSPWRLMLLSGIHCNSVFWYGKLQSSTGLQERGKGKIIFSRVYQSIHTN
jgi:hypothetical protein